MIFLFFPVSSLALCCRLAISVYDWQKCPLCTHTYTTSSIIYSPSYVTIFMFGGEILSPLNISALLGNYFSREWPCNVLPESSAFFFEILPYPRMNVHNMNMYAREKNDSPGVHSVQTTDSARFRSRQRKYARCNGLWYLFCFWLRPLLAISRAAA